MKRFFAALLSVCLLTGCLMLPAASEEEETFYIYSESAFGLLRNVGEALAEGADPAAVRAKMAQVAEEMDFQQEFEYACENVAAYDNANYRKIRKLLDGEEQRRLDIRTPAAGDSYWGSWSAYEMPEELNDAARAFLEDPKAEYCFEPFWWLETDFKSVLGTPFDSFKPSRPRAGYACVVIRKGAQILPETNWKADEDISQEALYSAVSSLAWALEEDAPVLTGNPNLASTFWVFDLRYPFHGYYGDSAEDAIKGYDLDISLSVISAASKEPIAEIAQSEKLSSTIYGWEDWGAAPDVPNLSQNTKYETFVRDVRVALGRERSADLVNRKINYSNAPKVLNALLLKQADAADDPWEKAIYEAGARDIDMEGEQLSFSLRTFDPRLEEMSPYSQEENLDSWLSQALYHTAESPLKVTVNVYKGILTHTSMNNLKKEVKAAAARAREAFENENLQEAIFRLLAPSPLAGKAKTAEDLVTPDSAFEDWTYMALSHTGQEITPQALAPLFYPVKNRRLITEDGPNGLRVEFTGVDAPKALHDTAQKVLDDLAFARQKDRPDEAPQATLRKALANAALTEKADTLLSFPVPIPADPWTLHLIPQEFQDYLRSYDYEETAERLTESAEQLPAIAARSMPKNGRLSGGTSGASTVILKVSENSRPTYVCIRSASSGKVVATAFIHPGKQVSMDVSPGKYYIDFCSGPYWYGEEDLFANAGSYTNMDDPVTFQRNYSHTYILETSDEGTIGVHNVDPEEFRRKNNR